MIRLVLNKLKKCKENFKAVKMHPLSKGMATPTNLSTTDSFEGCGLQDIIRGTIPQDVYEKAFILISFKPLQQLESDEVA